MATEPQRAFLLHLMSRSGAVLADALSALHLDRAPGRSDVEFVNGLTKVDASRLIDRLKPR